MHLFNQSLHPLLMQEILVQDSLELYPYLSYSLQNSDAEGFQYKSSSTQWPVQILCAIGYRL